ncbi:unnamed protein product [Ectocarpus sp. CCAP 1310/34]|nr:unnamed protein product [Ectocarpus sp. CCAP 1310/34]
MAGLFDQNPCTQVHVKVFTLKWEPPVARMVIRWKCHKVLYRIDSKRCPQD